MSLQQNKLIVPKLSKVINLLGKILGKVIKEQQGEKYFNKIEEIRILSKKSRGKKDLIEIKKYFNKLKLKINALNSIESLVVARAFSQFLNFANLSESLYSVYKINENKVTNSKITDEFIDLELAIKKIINKKLISKSKFYKYSKELKINLVLTAHPTEVKRRTLIQKYTKINNIIENFNTKKNFKNNLKELENSLYEEMTSIWKTDEIKRIRPTPIEEAKWGLAIIEDSLWNAIPKICRKFDKIIHQYTKKYLPINYSPIKFGSWMGGDRDGNPFVTSKTTKEIILLSRWMAANLYAKELTKLIQELSMHECSKNLRKLVGKTNDPYRVFLRPIRNKMIMTQKIIELHLNKNEKLDESLLVNSIYEVIEPLNIIYKSLIHINCHIIANGEVLNLLRRCHAFGLNLAKIDIRQNSLQHKNLINSIFDFNGFKDFEKWNESKKIKFLINKIKSNKNLLSKKIKLNKENNETLETFKMLKDLPEECLGSYIISNTSNISDILSVMFLQKETGVKNYLNIVPLFETLKDLNNADKIMEKLFRIPIYLKIFKRKQEIMIGYSDSSKDAGNFAASWSIYQVQEKLYKISKRNNINLTLFHGRGGSIGRGGGPVYAALLSQPPGTVNGKTKVTEQGEVIQQKFSTESIAEYSLGTYIGSVLEATLSPPIKPKKNWIKLMNKMSTIGNISYKNQLINNPEFLRYYNTVTPQKILEKIFIGSRPTKRNKTNKIKDLRAIPWVFAWTQIRLILPAWLGTLEALEYGSKKNNLKFLKQMFNKWPFFYQMMDMLDMVLTKTDIRVIKFYENCLADKNLKNVGNKLTKQLSLLIKLNKILIPNKMINQRNEYRESVKIRNTYAETLNLLQANIIKKLNNNKMKKNEKENYNDAMMVTVAGIAAAMKNTG